LLQAGKGLAGLLPVQLQLRGRVLLNTRVQGLGVQRPVITAYQHITKGGRRKTIGFRIPHLSRERERGRKGLRVWVLTFNVIRASLSIKKELIIMILCKEKGEVN
jgi:hypothetical protein